LIWCLQSTSLLLGGIKKALCCLAFMAKYD
jgi:hypothetical protein